MVERGAGLLCDGLVDARGVVEGPALTEHSRVEVDRHERGQGCVSSSSLSPSSLSSSMPSAASYQRSSHAAGAAMVGLAFLRIAGVDGR